MRGSPAVNSLGFARVIAAGIIVALWGLNFMIEALFNQPNYLAAKKTLDAVALRQEAINNNLANLETPGYKRVDLAPDFDQELQIAVWAMNEATSGCRLPSKTNDL